MLIESKINRVKTFPEATKIRVRTGTYSYVVRAIYSDNKYFVYRDKASCHVITVEVVNFKVTSNFPLKVKEDDFFAKLVRRPFGNKKTWKLTKKDTRAMKKLIQNGEMQSVIADLYGVSRAYVSLLKRKIKR
jgi:hypothetical protein